MDTPGCRIDLPPPQGGLQVLGKLSGAGKYGLAAAHNPTHIPSVVSRGPCPPKCSSPQHRNTFQRYGLLHVP